MKRILSRSFLFGLFMFAMSISFAEPIKVGLVGEPPFVITDGQQAPEGIAVELWKTIATKLKLEYQFVPLGQNVNQAIEQLQTGKVQILVGGIAVTSARLQYGVFSRPFFINSLGLVSAHSTKSFLKIAFDILSQFAQAAFLIYLVLLLVFALIHWVYESRQSKQVLSFRGFFEALYQVTVGMFTLGYPEFPRAPLAKLNTVFCVLVGLTFATIFSAAITSAMTIYSSDLNVAEDISNPFYLKGQVVAAITGSYAEYFATHVIKTKTIPVPNFSDSLASVNGTTPFLGDYVSAKYLLNAQGSNFSIARFPATSIEMAFMFPSANPLRAKVDDVLTYLQDNDQMRTICKKYLDKEDVRDCYI